MKLKFLIFSFLLIYSCKSPDDFKNLCDVPFIFTEDKKDLIDFDLILTEVFQPYCSKCHTTESFLSTITKRNGYIPLDENIKSQLIGNLDFYNTFAKYIDFQNPKNSILLRVTEKAGISREPFDGLVEYKEPRFQCGLPDDVRQGMIWWIEKANGSIDKLFN